MRNVADKQIVFDEKYFKELLKEKGLKQYELSNITGIAVSSLSDLMNGKFKRLNATFLYKIAIALDVQIEDLLMEV